MMARFTSTGQAAPVRNTSRRLDTSWRARSASGQRDEPGEVRGHHGGGGDLPSLDGLEHGASASNRGSTPTGVPAARARTALSGPVWCSGATTRWRPRPTKRLACVASTNSAHDARGGNTLGGRCVAFGRPVVPEVKSRFGHDRARRRAVGRRARWPASRPSQRSSHAWTSQPPTDRGRLSGAVRGGRSGDDQGHVAGFELVRGLAGREVAVDRHHRCSRPQSAEVGDRPPPPAFSANTATRRRAAVGSAPSGGRPGQVGDAVGQSHTSSRPGPSWRRPPAHRPRRGARSGTQAGTAADRSAGPWLPFGEIRDIGTLVRSAASVGLA